MDFPRRQNYLSMNNLQCKDLLFLKRDSIPLDITESAKKDIEIVDIDEHTIHVTFTCYVSKYTDANWTTVKSPATNFSAMKNILKNSNFYSRAFRRIHY